ncbi:MAG: 50S ribosomal protein L10 [Eubacteriales bacterium]|nr:50S ribosomal protein L10 [Eubacteriales bacterium]
MANAQVLEQKKKIVSDLAAKMQNAVAGVIVDYKGINVEDDTKLRAELRKAGVEYSVIKNTLTAKACDEIGYGKLKEVLEGMTALAVSNSDPIAAAKILNAYASKHDNYVIKAGFVEGELLDPNGVKALAEIPGFETLIAKMLGSFQSSLYNLAYALQAIIDKSGESSSAEAAPAAE